MKTCKSTTEIDLANSWADTGDVYESNSWIEDFDNDHVKDILTTTNFSTLTDTHDSSEQFDSVYYYKLNGDFFTLVNKAKMDSTGYINFLKEKF